MDKHCEDCKYFHLDIIGLSRNCEGKPERIKIGHCRPKHEHRHECNAEDEPCLYFAGNKKKRKPDDE